MFSVKAQTVSLCLGDSQTSFMISEEHWKNDEILFQNVYRYRESVVLRLQVMLITYCYCDFLFHGYPCMTKKNVML